MDVDEHEEQSLTSPTRRARVLGGAVSLLFAGAVLWTIIGPNISPRSHAEHAVLPEEHKFAIDSVGVYYSYLDHQARYQTVRSRAMIPEELRGVVVIWHEQWGARPEAYQGAYVADLSELGPGMLATARLRSSGYVHAATHAADSGAAHGVLTHFLASEIANFSPQSTRHANARDALELMKEIEKRRIKTYEEIEAEIRAEARKRRELYEKKIKEEASRKQ